MVDELSNIPCIYECAKKLIIVRELDKDHVSVEASLIIRVLTTKSIYEGLNHFLSFCVKHINHLLFSWS